MKSGLSLKFLILATLACVVFTIMDIHLHKATGIRWFSPRDFKAVLTWLVILIAWIVYIVERIRKK